MVSKSFETLPQIKAITGRIIERSQPYRQAYLQRCEKAFQSGKARVSLSCGNLAHAMAACDQHEKQQLAGANSANLAIISAYNDMLSAHQPYGVYPQLIKQFALQKGATAQVAGGVPAMCDGVTQGQPGMELSLFSRDAIAMATAISLSHNMFEGSLCLGVCDKIVPGMLIGALSFGHLPTAFVPAGPMPSGISNAEKAKVREDYAQRKIGKSELLAAESAAYHSPGTCTFYGTANSNQLLMEIMGLHLPGSSFVQPMDPLRNLLTQATVERLIDNIETRESNFTLANILDEKAIVNGIVGLLASGGSTNHTIHLVAIARAAGIIIDWQDIADLSSLVPLICRIYPNGELDINHFQQAGGMAFFMRELSENGFLNQDVNTLMGKGLEAYFLTPTLVSNPNAQIFNQSGTHGHTEYLLKWQNMAAVSSNLAVLRPAAEPFAKEGGLKLLTGNIGRAMIKVSAVAPEHWLVEAPAHVFESQAQFERSFHQGLLNKDFIAVIRNQGPKANGMPELHKLTPILGVLQKQGFKVALVTDGRMSGASGRIPAAIHVIPEAIEDGVIGQICNGDVITLNATTGELLLHVDPDALAARTAYKNDSTEHETGMGRELFAHARKQVTCAEQGASILYSALEKTK